jgi:RNA polymerase sigma-70 factor, ECF subfamily
MNKTELRQFYQETVGKLKIWVGSRVDDPRDVEEIVQDAYWSFVDSLPLFRGGSSLWTFLVSIAKHEVADYWRKKYAKKAILTVPFVDQVYTEKLYSSAVTASEIENIYQQLLLEERLILVMKYEEGLGLMEIAGKLGISVKAAESRLFRARKAFRLVYER